MMKRDGDGSSNVVPFDRSHDASSRSSERGSAGLTGPQSAPCFEHRFEPAPEGVPSTRHALRAWLEHRDTDADVTYDALLVATELAELEDPPCS